MPNAPISTRTVTIKSGQSQSEPVDLTGQILVGIRIPASGWSSNAALTFLHTPDLTGTFKSVYTATGSELQVTIGIADSEIRDIPELNFSGFIKLRSGTAQTPVNQGADRAIELVLRSA